MSFRICLSIPEATSKNLIFPYLTRQICVYGPNVFKGYLYDEKKTKETIDEDGWLHSGDIGEWLPVSGVVVLIRFTRLNVSFPGAPFSYV